MIATIQHNEANAAQAEKEFAAKRHEILSSHIADMADEAHHRVATTVKKLKRMSSDRDASQHENVELRKTVETHGARWRSSRASCTAWRQTWPALTGAVQPPRHVLVRERWPPAWRRARGLLHASLPQHFRSSGGLI